MNHLSKAAFVAIIALAGAASAQTSAPLPDALRPGRIAGAGLNVTDLLAQKAWYETRLGMKVGWAPSRPDRRARVNISCRRAARMTGARCWRCSRPQPGRRGPNGFGRIIIKRPPTLRVWLRFLASQGVPMREVIPGSAYFITDPEGNAIELYNPLPPKAK